MARSERPDEHERAKRIVRRTLHLTSIGSQCVFEQLATKLYLISRTSAIDSLPN